MKKIILSLLFVSAFGYSQTTNTEYNYLTKGLREQLEKGLDLKAGYTLKKIYDVDVDTYSFTYSLFFKEDKLSAIYVDVKSNRTLGVNVYDLCIPFENNELMSEYYSSMAFWDSSILRAYNVATSKFLSSFYYKQINDKISQLQKK